MRLAIAIRLFLVTSFVQLKAGWGVQTTDVTMSPTPGGIGFSVAEPGAVKRKTRKGEAKGLGKDTLTLQDPLA